MEKIDELELLAYRGVKFHAPKGYREDMERRIQIGFDDLMSEKQKRFADLRFAAEVTRELRIRVSMWQTASALLFILLLILLFI